MLVPSKGQDQQDLAQALPRSVQATTQDKDEGTEGCRVTHCAGVRFDVCHHTWEYSQTLCSVQGRQSGGCNSTRRVAYPCSCRFNESRTCAAPVLGRALHNDRTSTNQNKARRRDAVHRIRTCCSLSITACTDWDGYLRPWLRGWAVSQSEKVFRRANKNSND